MSDRPAPDNLSTAAGGQPGRSVDEPRASGRKSARRPAKPVDNAAPVVHKPVDDPAEPVDSDAAERDQTPDLARSVLDGVRAGNPPVAGRGSRTPGAAARRRIREQNLAGRNRGGYSGAGRDPDRDPHPIGGLVQGFVAEQGWERPLADARVFAEWPALVGAEVAAHCEPQSLRDGELRVAAESTAWATQLRLLSSVLLSRLVAELGPHVVRRISITGPVPQNLWSHGPRRVHGARGPRDTYG